ncbi:MAG: YhbY family RNA-binding protein [Burkholderiales bacterium]|nr:YhbY family RNA-binding protein [Burkholderiales bacterium]MDE2287508.1 YhbY family RNA-binding protein [Burkholderiales bacterium]MDE2610434.1 YhbY family RNA-binding protein [Burkholderiales bacterium]
MPALSLSPARRAELRSEAHALNPVVLIGADGLTPAVLKEIDLSLNAHQLIKVRVFGDQRDERLAIYESICDRLNAAPVQHIGKLLVIWRPAEPSKAADAPGARKGRGPKVVTVIKSSTNPGRRPTVKKVVVRGNERLTSGGLLKKAKKRQSSVKRRQSDA